MSTHSAQCVVRCVNLGVQRFNGGDDTAVSDVTLALSYTLIPEHIKRVQQKPQ